MCSLRVPVGTTSTPPPSHSLTHSGPTHLPPTPSGPTPPLPLPTRSGPGPAPFLPPFTRSGPAPAPSPHMLLSCARHARGSLVPAALVPSGPTASTTSETASTASESLRASTSTTCVGCSNRRGAGTPRCPRGSLHSSDPDLDSLPVAYLRRARLPGSHRVYSIAMACLLLVPLYVLDSYCSFSYFLFFL